jgi:hypothetical protein
MQTNLHILFLIFLVGYSPGKTNEIINNNSKVEGFYLLLFIKNFIK